MNNEGVFYCYVYIYMIDMQVKQHGVHVLQSIEADIRCNKE